MKETEQNKKPRKKGSGGARPNAGRKAPLGRKITFGARLTPATYDKMQEMRDEYGTISEVVENAVICLYEKK